jgi:hypothetical protein
MKKLIISENGCKYLNINDSELKKTVTSWHMPEYKYRLVVSVDTQKMLLERKAENEITGNFPDAEFLLNHFKERRFFTIQQGLIKYVYLENVLPEHEPLLDKNNIQIETNG